MKKNKQTMYVYELCNKIDTKAVQQNHGNDVPFESLCIYTPVICSWELRK